MSHYHRTGRIVLRSRLRGLLALSAATGCILAAGGEAARQAQNANNVSLPTPTIDSPTDENVIALTAIPVADGVLTPVHRDIPAPLRTSEPISVAAPPIQRNTARTDSPVTSSRGACSRDIQCDDCNSCTNDLCVGGTCAHLTLPDGAVCGDDVFCNGTESCDSGTCLAGTVPECGALVCDENAGACSIPCSADTDCDDGLKCTSDQCINQLCVPATGPCGPGGTCVEPADPEDPVICGLGRCCDALGDCTRETFQDCQQPGDAWLAAGSAGSTCEDEPCPLYGAGVAPEGAFVHTVGPIGFATCDPITELGDDYRIAGDGSFYYSISTVRWVGGVDRAGDVVTLRWYDEDLNLVGNEFVTIDTTDLALHTFDLPVPLTVPEVGFFAISVAGAFTPQAQIRWLSTDQEDVGTNDPATLWLNGGPVDASTGFPEGTTGILTFEMVGDPVSAPLGACCDSETGECSRVLPWQCEASGNLFQGAGVACRVCANNPFLECAIDDDCPACVGVNDPGASCDSNAECPNGICDGGSCLGGDNNGLACDPDVDCAAGDTCSGTTSCFPVPPACTLSACCVTEAGIAFCEGGLNPGDACPKGTECIGGTCTGITAGPGECVTVRGASCSESLGPCFDDNDCTGGSDMCEPSCPSGSVPQGFGTSCDPNCCTQPGTSGGDTCSGPQIHGLAVPNIGESPIEYAFAGDNSGATGPDSCETLAPDPVWWETFDFLRCAEIQISFCCSDPVKVPAYRVLYSDCPCGEPIPSSTLLPPIGNNEGVSNGFGEPFCSDGNFGVTFGPLPPGMYYYPVYSDDGSLGPYQIHMTVAACTQAACCLPSSFCVDVGESLAYDLEGGPIPCGDGNPCAVGSCEFCARLNQFECDDIGGFWNAGENLPADQPDPIVTCAGEPCSLGSCCQGPGDCRDDSGGGAGTCDPQVPLTCMDRFLCVEILEGIYAPGAQCDFPEAPCPVCELEGPDACQPLEGSVVLLSDVDGGAVQADNFIPAGQSLNSVCVSGAWIDSNATGTRVDCACQLDDIDNCEPLVTDAFTVSIYADDNGQPGTLIASRSSSELEVVKGVNQQFENFDLWDFTFTFFDPIDLQATDQCRWIEVKNNTEGGPGGCNWYWANSDMDGLGATGGGVDPPDATTPFDMAFCVDSGLTPGGCGERRGACCDCDGTCVADLLEEECLRGTWSFGATCGEITCENVGFGNDDCLTAMAPIAFGLTLFDNLCATTDGPTPVDCETGTQAFGRDIWYEYTAECDGVLSISLCPEVADSPDDATNFDSIVAVYGDETASCSCPTNALTQIGCDDDSCVGSGGAAGAPNDLPTPCEEPGCGKGASELCVPVTQGNCYTVRVGGVNGARGSGTIKLSCVGPIIYVDADAGAGNHDGLSWADAFTDLQDALELAFRVAECDASSLVPQIWVANGIYKPDRGSQDRQQTFLIGNGVQLYGGFAGGETSLSDRAPLTNETILSGDIVGLNSYHVVTTRATDPTTVLDGFVIEGGDARSPAPDPRGAGLLIEGGSPTIVNCIFRTNVADIGAAVYTEGGSPTFANCLFYDNSAEDRSAAIHIQGGSPTIANCTITGNTTTALGVAGGIGVADGTPAISNCILWENQNGDAEDGGFNGTAQLAILGGAPVVRYSTIQSLVGGSGFFGNIDEDPRFEDAFASLFELLPGSPAIDSGDSFALPQDLSDTDGNAVTSEPLPLDLARVTRSLNDGTADDTGRGSPEIVDMGPFERDPDCNENDIPDECDLKCTGRCVVYPGCDGSVDCNGDKVPDECEINEASTAPGGPYYCKPLVRTCDEDCNNNGNPDACDSPDCNENNIPDECEVEFLPAELNASVPSATDDFGRSVAVSEGLAVVGSPLDDDAENCEPCADSGSAYIYGWNGVRWNENAKLTASDAEAGDTFGAAVAIDGGLLVIGAPLDGNTGSAYVFRREGRRWTQEAKLVASDAAQDDQFGVSVAISGFAVVVGAPATGTLSPGAAYVFRRSGVNWSPEGKLTASDAANPDEFGRRVSIDGDVVLVGEHLDDKDFTDSGSAYVFRYDDVAGIWNQEQKLWADNAAGDDHFGASVAVSGNVALVGANATDDGGSDSGSAYVFRYDDVLLTWVVEQELTASDAAAGDQFGESVSLRGTRALVGALVGDVSDSGSAYLYHRGGTSWIEDVALTTLDLSSGDQFGVSVSVGSDFMAVGAPLHNHVGDLESAAFVYLVAEDCNGDNEPDDCDIASCAGDPVCGDCNLNRRPDACDIADGTSIDVQAPNGVPDECKGFDNEGVDINWGTAENWEADEAPTTTSSVTIDGATVTVDVAVDIQSLELAGGSTLSVDAGDLNVDSDTGRIDVTDSSLDVNAHTIGGADLDVSGGVVALTGDANTTITLTKALTITEGGIVKPMSETGDQEASITVKVVDIRSGGTGPCSEMDLRDRMDVVTEGDFVMDGQKDFDSAFCSRATASGGAAARGGGTRPIMKIRPPTSADLESVRRGGAPLLDASLTVKGAYRILNVAEICVGCATEPPFELCGQCQEGEDNEVRRATVALEGDFDNQSRYVTFFSWEHGGLILQGTSPQTFEVAGIDVGSTNNPTSFASTDGTNTEPEPVSREHTNFAIGTLRVAGVADVTFRNAVTNTVGSGNCAEALYVDDLILENGSKITLDNSRVYFNTLQRTPLNQTIESIGCGALVPNCAGDRCAFSPPVAVNGANAFTTECANNDEPTSVVCDSGIVTVNSDVWFTHTSTCDGLLAVSLFTDKAAVSVLELYNNPSNPTVCACPLEGGAQTACADVPGVAGLEIRQGTRLGDCWMIRVGLQSGTAGSGEVLVSCTPGCVPSSPAEQETIFVENLGAVLNAKNRMISMAVGDPGQRQAIRLVIQDSEEDHLKHLIGQTWYAGPKEAISEQGGSKDPLPAFPNFWASKMRCKPFFGEWHGLCTSDTCVGGLNGGVCEGSVCVGGQDDAEVCSEDTDCRGAACTTNEDCGGFIHLYGEAIVPGMTYTVQVIDETCDSGDELSFSETTVMRTSQFGDILTSCGQTPCSPAGDGASINDVFASIQRFATQPGAPSKTRAEAEPSSIDLVMNITDVLAIVTAFQGLPYFALKCPAQVCVGGPNAGEFCVADGDCALPACPAPQNRRIASRR